MDTYVILKDLAIIIVFAKLFGILARKCKAPQVVGELIAGIVLGPSVLGLVQQSDFLAQMAEIGVILLMFSAGLGTSLKDLLRTGVKSLLIACAGVFVPLVLGAVLYMSFYGFSAVGTEEFYHAVFIGVILTATSVSITVQALKELGKLKTEVGTTVLNAAIIDDVIGIIVLTVVIGFKDPTSNPLKVAASTILFFALAIVLGFLCFKLFNRMNSVFPHTRRLPILGLALCFGLSYISEKSVFPHTRRLPILGLALCFGLSYISEKYFGIADITGAYVAGVILCSLDSSDYIEEKMDISSYMIFGPIFFASIGLKTTLSGMNEKFVLFAICFVIVGLVAKIIGCGLMSKGCGFTWGDSLKIGVGMMTRGEVCLIVAQKGLNAGFLSGDFFSAVILLILFSSIATPIMLKILYEKMPTAKDSAKAS